jgi:hypothetical protein
MMWWLSFPLRLVLSVVIVTVYLNRTAWSMLRRPRRQQPQGTWDFW